MKLEQNQILRLASPQDVPELTKVINQAYKELSDMGLNYTGSYQDEELTKSRMAGRDTFVLLEEGRIIASIALVTVISRHTKEKCLDIGQLAVLPSQKRKGIGSKLLEFAEESSISKGIYRTQLDTATPAKHLVNMYSKRGYKVVAEDQWVGKTYRSFIMEKILKKEIKGTPFYVKMLAPEDVENLVSFIARDMPTSGVDGNVLFHPFPREFRVDPATKIPDVLESWAVPAGTLGWARNWGLFEGSKIIGGVTLSSGRQMETQVHRAMMSMGIESGYQSSGYGKVLLGEALRWAKAQEFLSWVDLGVFTENERARRLYKSFGFREVGRIPDLFRVDGRRVEDIQMALELKDFNP